MIKLKHFLVVVTLFVLQAVGHRLSRDFYFELGSEVRDGLRLGHPVVALESTVITHGLPYPVNVQTAKALEQIIRDAGAVPATIAIIRGTIFVGLNESQLAELAETGRQGQALKTSRRDLAAVVATNRTGSTTVSATVLVAHMAGIRFFATGGIGGVHRDGHITMDVSADLRDLGRTFVTVVCAGAKSILDLPRTLQYLETEGVPVIGYRTDEFPAFFSRKSGQPVSMRIDDVESIARVVEAQEALGIGSGIIVAVPIPESDAASAEPLERYTELAIAEAAAANVTGNEVTPFLLRRVAELSNGSSQAANIALLRNNARVASEIAVAYNRRHGHGWPGMVMTAATMYNPATGMYTGLPAAESVPPMPQTPSVVSGRGRAIIFGGAAIDLISQSTAAVAGTSNPGRVGMRYGGVGSNIANVLAKLGGSPLLVTAIGADDNGRLLRNHLASLGLSHDGLHTDISLSTAVYNAILDGNGELIQGVADMSVLETLSPQMVESHAEAVAAAGLIVLDGNLSEETTAAVLDLAQRQHVPVFFEPTSIAKAAKVGRDGLAKLTYTAPNADELAALVSLLHGASVSAAADDTELERQATELVAAGVKHVFVTLGERGVLWATAAADGSGTQFKRWPAFKPSHVENVTGAGDSFVGGVAWALLQGKSVEDAVSYGLRAAQLSVESSHAVSEHPPSEA
eukprot:TRINITY_DN10164_c0_g1_i1.p1 TRINITY_DN10164_c0_g1~~TRINITY_DN10164_c0_g1_i1.p1  ORF type:complete len:695 (+),score=287.19 TRINITY_DN10164_c0_g1_i1:23-2086(+)